MSYIIFPTDFSQRSSSAYIYALEFAYNVKKDLIVYHTYQNIDESDGEEIYGIELIKLFRKSSDAFTPYEEIHSASYPELKVIYVAEQGPFLETLEKYIEQDHHHIDTIMMGSRSGRLGILSDLFDQVSVQILKRMEVDLVVIPNKASFKGKLDHILYLVDYTDKNLAVLENYLDSYHPEGATLHVVHFDLAHTEGFTHKMQAVKERLASRKENIIYDVVDSNDLLASLKSYCPKHEIDLICLMSHQQGKGWFSKTNQAEELIEHLVTPIMVAYPKL